MKVTEPVRRAFHSVSAPVPKLIVDLVDVPPRGQEPGFVAVRVYRDNISDYSDTQVVKIHGYLEKLVKNMRLVEPDTYIEVYDYPPEAKHG